MNLASHGIVNRFKRVLNNVRRRLGLKPIKIWYGDPKYGPYAVEYDLRDAERREFK